MTDFAPVQPENATGKAAELLAQVQRSLGLTPNMTKVMANSPALLQGYLALSGAVATGALPAGVREQLAIATAQLNGCEYCLSAHTYIGANIAKVDAGELDSARRGESDDAHVAALLKLSNTIAENAGEDVNDVEVKAAREAGVTDEEIGEVVANLALNILTELERATGRTIFTTVPMDTADSGSVKSAITWIDQPLHAVVMNAGGTGGATPMALTKDGATEIFASNVLGHVVLLEQLIDLGALTNTAVLTGSEAARGVPKLRIKRPAFSDHSVDEFACVIDGSFFAGGKVDPSLAYSQVKYLGALWMSALARQYPELRLVTMSPGNTAGTKVFSDMPWLMRTLMDGVLMPHVLPALRLSRTVDVGAKRLVDATVDYTFRSGVFYASAASTLTGPVVDQAGIITDFDDPTIQDHANEAIHRYVPDRTS